MPVAAAVMTNILSGKSSGTIYLLIICAIAAEALLQKKANATPDTHPIAAKNAVSVRMYCAALPGVMPARRSTSNSRLRSPAVMTMRLTSPMTAIEYTITLNTLISLS